MASATRDHFSSRLGVLAATLGSAVGLGNIWKFPSLVGQNGGASFLVVYLLASLCIGLPLMISDLSLGRAGRSNVISIFQKLAPRTGWCDASPDCLARLSNLLGAENVKLTGV